MDLFNLPIDIQREIYEYLDFCDQARFRCTSPLATSMINEITKKYKFYSET